MNINNIIPCEPIKGMACVCTMLNTMQKLEFDKIT